jgi:hypothetical protein
VLAFLISHSQFNVRKLFQPSLLLEFKPDLYAGISILPSVHGDAIFFFRGDFGEWSNANFRQTNA